MDYPHKLAAHILTHDRCSDDVKKLIVQTREIHRELLKTQEKLFIVERDLKVSENTVYQLQVTE